VTLTLGTHIRQRLSTQVVLVMVGDLVLTVIGATHGCSGQHEQLLKNGPVRAEASRSRSPGRRAERGHPGGRRPPRRPLR